MTTRRAPDWAYVRSLARPAPFEFDATTRRLARAHTIGDLRTLARRRVPRVVFDYVDGAAGEEISLARARNAFRRLEFVPSVLRDVSAVDTATTMLGADAAWPFAFAPTGFTRMMNHEGEPAVARVARDAGIPYTLSTMGTTSIEDLAEAVPDADRWFQLYVWRDRDASRGIVRRAAEAGYRALVFTVDTPVAGARIRDVRNGMSVPPALSVRNLLDAAAHPGWWANLLTTPPLEFASMRQWGGTVAEMLDFMFDPSITFEDVAWLREEWPGPLVVKGVTTARDAAEAVDHGADAVIVSNHGGRQLDRAPTPLEQLPAVVAAVGDRAEVYLDGGVTSGADVVAAVALGARGCFVGRAYLYGLMAGGERGAQRAVDILRTDVVRTMSLLGARSIGELHPALVRLRP